MLSTKRAKHAGTYVVRVGLSAVLAFSLAGCGGGGGGSSTSSTSSPTSLSITQTNSPQVAGAGYNAMNGATGASTTGALGLTGVVVSGSGSLPSLASFVQQQVTNIQSLNASGTVSTSMAGLTGGGTVQCTYSGTMTVTVTGSGTTFGPGDTAAVTFNNCSATSGGYTINGSFQFTVSTLSGTLASGSTWSLGGTFTFTNLSLTTAGATETVNGGFSFSANSASGTTDSTLTGTSLTVQQPSGTSLTLASFSLSASDDTGTGATSFYGSGQVTDSALNGYVKFAISSATPFVEYSGQSYPSSGTMTITGANNTRIVMTVLDSTSVQLQEDTTGNGTYDNTVTEAWTSLGS